MVVTTHSFPLSSEVGAGAVQPARWGRVRRRRIIEIKKLFLLLISILNLNPAPKFEMLRISNCGRPEALRALAAPGKEETGLLSKLPIPVSSFPGVLDYIKMKMIIIFGTGFDYTGEAGVRQGGSGLFLHN